jgi:ATP-binding cassette, subfamily A (ABC1), member 3
LLLGEDGMLQLIDAMVPNSRWQSLAIRLASVHIAFDIIYAPGWVIMGVVAGTVAFPHTNTGYLVLLYLLTGFALTGYSILASTLFRRVQISAISSILAAIVFALVAQFAEGPFTSGASLTGVIPTAVLFAPSAFVYFLIDTALFESRGNGLEITTGASGWNWSLAAIVFVGYLILQIVLYPVIGALLERWLHGHSSRSRHVRATAEMGGKAIRLDGFTKNYNIAAKKRDRVCAVENLSLEVHAGTITVLLGSNGRWELIVHLLLTTANCSLNR